MAKTKKNEVEVGAKPTSNGITEDEAPVRIPTGRREGQKVSMNGVKTAEFKFDIMKLLAKTKAQARPYQQRIITKVIRSMTATDKGGKGLRSALINSPTGCLTGDTVVTINLGGKSQKFTMKEAYIHFHGGDPKAMPGICGCGCGEATKIPRKTNRTKGQVAGQPLRYVHGHQPRAMRWESTPYVRAFRGEHGLGRQKVLNIVESGVKEVYTLTLLDGKQLRGTACHRIMTDRGWVPLGQLEPGMLVMVDNANYKKKDGDLSKPRDKFIWNMWNHPFGRRVTTNKEKRGYTIRVPKHVAVYEATANGLTMEEYVDICRNGDPTDLILVDPSSHVVHHKDHNHSNNQPDNLQLMTIAQHLEHHGDHRHLGMSTPEWTSVVSVVKSGQEMTYDICCEQPYHNFVANGIVVHNSGKTVMALLIGKALQVREDCLIVWISMRRNLLAQAANENDAPSDLNPRGKAICAKIHFVSMFEKNLPAEVLPANRNGRKLLIIVDEAQHDAANSCAHIHAQLQGDYILGMTATPFRTDRVKLCFDTVINDAGIGALIKEGYLSRYEHFTIPKWGVKESVECYLRDKERWGKSIFYFHTIKQCLQATELLRAAGVEVEMVTGDSDRDTQLARFASGESQVIVNCMVLTEGFDCPDLQTVFLRPSCKGVTIQMAGRAFRIHPSVPVKRIVQCEKTKWPFVKTAEPVCAYKWQLPSGKPGTPGYKEGMWLSLTPNPHINEMNCKMLVTLAGLDTKLPEFMTKAKLSKRGRMAKKRL